MKLSSDCHLVVDVKVVFLFPRLYINNLLSLKLASNTMQTVNFTYSQSLSILLKLDSAKLQTELFHMLYCYLYLYYIC